MILLARVEVDSMKKNRGSANIMVVFYIFLIVVIGIWCFAYERYSLNTTAEIARDSIVFSNLACYKEIDKLALGDTPSVLKFNDPYTVLETFKTYLKKNMRLDDNLCGVSGSIAVGQVVVKKYIIYNINGNAAEIMNYDYTNNIFSTSVINDMSSSPVTTPCGSIVKKTTIHTTIEFQIQPIMQGVFGKTRTVDVMADTDVTY